MAHIHDTVKIKLRQSLGIQLGLITLFGGSPTGGGWGC